MSAASRVFQVPELLENIMMQLADSAMVVEEEDRDKEYDPNSDSAAHLLQPIAALSPLHRVDRTFNAVLKGSPKLQRAMFEHPGYFIWRDEIQRAFDAIDRSGLTEDEFEDAKEAIETEMRYLPVTPMDWIIENKLELAVHGDDLWPTQGKLIYIFPNDAAKLGDTVNDFLGSKIGNSEASWRKVRMFQCTAKEDRVYGFYVQWGCQDRSKGGWRVYVEEVEFPDGMLLGDFFERVAEIMSRTRAEHVATAGKMRRNFHY